jgi:hypothetical protein
MGSTDATASDTCDDKWRHCRAAPGAPGRGALTQTSAPAAVRRDCDPVCGAFNAPDPGAPRRLGGHDWHGLSDQAAPCHLSPFAVT